MAFEFNPTRRALLAALCDTYAPSLPLPPDPEGFWARKASDLNVPIFVEQTLLAALPQDALNALLGILDGLESVGFISMPQQAREATLQEISAFPGVSILFHNLRSLALLLFYSLPGPDGQNPNWKVMGYPGPRIAPPNEPKIIIPLVPTGDELPLEADVVVVGSGSGGGVIAATLAAQGRSVIVLEAGGAYNEADFRQHEIWAYQNLYYRGGPTATMDGNVTLLAGSTLGGGTVVNWMNCVRTPEPTRREWAREYGLEGVDGPEFDRHLDAVLQRLNANNRASDFNAPNARIMEGSAKLGYKASKLFLNCDPEKCDFDLAGYAGFGDPSGSKQSGPKTFLLDAYRNGARFVVRCKAERILTESGSAVGVIGTCADEAGRRVRVTVRAPQVVVACGALESPALLLRSGIGGPAVGNYLRLHPASGLIGVYAEKQEGWRGWPQTAYCNEFADLGDGYGFLIETAAWAPGLGAAATPWTSGLRHKELVMKTPYSSSIIFIVRDRGYGHVELNANGDAAHFYPMSDERDRNVYRRALVEVARVHRAAGAREILPYSPSLPDWKEGDDFDAFLSALSECDPTATPFSARIRWEVAGWGKTRLKAWRIRGDNCMIREASG